jgi:hypothetical protein
MVPKKHSLSPKVYPEAGTTRLSVELSVIVLFKRFVEFTAVHCTTLLLSLHLINAPATLVLA